MWSVLFSHRNVGVVFDSRDWVEDMPVEIGIVHDRGVPTLHTRTPFRAEAVTEALAVTTLAAALVECVRVYPQKPH